MAMMDVFLTWMTAECNLSLPSLEEVLKKCPVRVSEDDDYFSLTRKIKAYMLDKVKR